MIKKNLALRQPLIFPWLIILFWLSSPVLAQNTGKQEIKAGEYIIKAAFIYNLAKFVEWPPDAFKESDDSMNPCVLGDDPFGSAIDALEGKSIRDKKLVVRRFKSLHKLKDCHILFICKDKAEKIEKLIKVIRGQHVLIIGDKEGLAEKNAVINFYIEHDKVRFEINPVAAKRARLKISSKLLLHSLLFCTLTKVILLSTATVSQVSIRSHSTTLILLQHLTIMLRHRVTMKS